MYLARYRYVLDDIQFLWSGQVNRLRLEKPIYFSERDAKPKPHKSKSKFNSFSSCKFVAFEEGRNECFYVLDGRRSVLLRGMVEEAHNFMHYVVIINYCTNPFFL